MNKKLTEAHHKAGANHVAFLYDTLGKTLKELNWGLKELSATDPSAYEAYEKKLTNFLEKSLKEKK